MSTHALYQSLLGAIFAGQSLSLLEILGVLLGLSGVFVMAFLDTCVAKYKLRKEIQRVRTLEELEMSAEQSGRQLNEK